MDIIKLRNATVEICAVCNELSYIVSISDEFCTNPLCPINLDEEDFIDAFVNNLLSEEINEYEDLLDEYENTRTSISDKQSAMRNLKKEDCKD